MKYTSLIIALISCLAMGILVSQEAPKTDKKKIVFLTADDTRHASGTHEFQAGAILLKNSLESSVFKEQLEIQLVNNWPVDSSVFDDADMIIHYYGGNKWHLMNENSAQFQKLSDAGVSQMFMHYAVDPDDDREASLINWTGGAYKDKDSTNPHWLLKSQLEKHIINSGVVKYESYDEWYTCIDFREGIEVDYEGPLEKEKTYSVMHGDATEYLKSKRVKKQFREKTTPENLTVMWAKERENGARGIGLTGGHYHKNWANDNFRMQVLNSIIWGLKMEVPIEGVKSPEITEEEINANLDPAKKGGLKKIKL
ncbi:hypothetical protein OAB00_02460 [Akkermansiaceae bacterium]|nr:hypothetical protein [Akkermansiaceae bacterium]